MLGIIFIAKTGTFNKDGIVRYLAKNLPTIQERDSYPAVLSHIQVAEKVNGSYEAFVLAATLSGEQDFESPTDTLFIAAGEEFGCERSDLAVDGLVQNLRSFGDVTHHEDLNCITCRGNSCSELTSNTIMNFINPK